MYASVRGTFEILIPDRVLYTHPTSIVKVHNSFPIRRRPKHLSSRQKFRKQSFIVNCSHPTSSESNSNASIKLHNARFATNDFVTRVLKENPNQVETKYLIGNRFYTLEEKEILQKKMLISKVFEVLKKLNLKALMKRKGEEGSRVKSGEVYLKDILREYKGKLYVPVQVFDTTLSEEEEFEKAVEELPKLSFKDFKKYMERNDVKLLTFKEESGISFVHGFRDFIVELKEMPNEKGLQMTKWAMKLDNSQAKAVLDEYTGQRCEVETQMAASIGKLPDIPHPIAVKLSTRMLSELGMLTAAMAAAAAFAGGLLVSAVLAVVTVVLLVGAYVVWPPTKVFLKLSLGLIFGILGRIWDFFAETFGDPEYLYELYTAFGGVSEGFGVLTAIVLVTLTMVFLIRFTISRRPRNFRKWDIWQGIEFSLSKPEARVDGLTGVTFKDVAGIDEAVEELQELVRYLKNPELFEKMGIKPPHGVLLEGPPGCGKTLVAKAIAGEAGVPFYQMAGSEFVEVLVGVGAARIRDLFKRAKVNKPSVIFVDEIDALATRRQGMSGESKKDLYDAATQERETTLNQLLIEMDGFDTGQGVIFLGATNRMDLLDPAILRPGRFDRKIKIKPPKAKGRLDILKVHARKVKLSESVDLDSYAKNLTGWSGARLAQLIQEACLVAARKGHDSILPSDMNDAVIRLTVGPKRVAFELGHQGQCRRATATLGAAITSHLLRCYEGAKVERCGIISLTPRGKSLMQVVFNRLDDEFYVFERRPQLLHRLQVLLGGRAAEEVIFGRDTSTASVGYLADASWLARKIITIWNLEDPMVIHGEPPPWRKRSGISGPRIDFEGSLYRHYGLVGLPLNLNLEDDVARRAEELIRVMYEKTLALLKQHSAALLKSVKVLLYQTEISGDEIDFIIQHYPPETPTSLVLEERDPGSLQFFDKKEQGKELEYSLLTQ